jgi:glycosyltransferase involved in cell wall biosynthesis
MKIAVISTTVFQLPIGNYGGLEVIAWECARGLAKKGHDVYLVAPDGSVCDGVTIIPIGQAGTIDEKMAWGGYPEGKNQHGQLVRRAHQGYWQNILQMDCVIDHSWQKFAYMLKAERNLKTPVLGVMHAPVNTMIGSPPPVEKPCFVCISEDQKRHLEALHDSTEARVCYNGFDTEFYKPLSIKRTDRYIFLARYSSIKGPDLAIQACLEAGVGLDMIGDTTITNEPELFQECMRLSEKTSPNWDHSKGRQIRVLGGVPRGETVYWYSQAKGMLHLNQRFREPFGLAPVEALACGCPVIAWKRGAMPETIVHNKTGYIVNKLQDAIDLLKKDAISTIDRNYCIQHAQKFSISNMVDRYNQLVLEAVETGGW